MSSEAGSRTESDARVLGNWIGGEPVPPKDGRLLEDVDPATGQVAARIPQSSAQDVDAAVAAAEAAFVDPAWANAGTETRARLLDAIADRIEGRLEELALLESLDTGKPVRLARTVDIPRAVANFRFFAGAIRHERSDLHAMHGGPAGAAGALNYTLRRPLGVVGLITPWNLPLYLLTWKTAPALAAGNAVVAKPSELTPQTADALAAIVAEAAASLGLPRGLFSLVHGLGPEAGKRLVEHPRVRAVSFTGGTETGRRVAAGAAPQFKKLSLELGGKNPTLVFADCDLERTVEGVARAGFANQGQICLCGSRLLVERSIHDAFVERLVERVQAMKVGDPRAEESDLGSLVSQAHREKVEGYLDLARAEGGEVLCGGERPDLPAPFDRGAFVTPAVVTGLTPECRTAQEEIFGPVVSVHPFADEAAALAIANGVRYGLSASVWTRDLSRAHRVSAALECGLVWVNTWLLRDLRVPFGGVKESGVGREGGRYSLEFFSESKNVCVQL